MQKRMGPLQADKAFNAFKRALPPGVVVGDATGFSIIPLCEAHIQIALNVANDLQSLGDLPAPLVATSTDKNWGYDMGVWRGIPLRLHKLNQITNIDPASNLVTIQPGVTNIDLFNALAKTPGMRCIFPRTGAGPHASPCGNTLNDGFGAHSQGDHFEHVHALNFLPGSGDDIVMLEHLNLPLGYSFVELFDHFLSHRKKYFANIFSQQQFNSIVAGIKYCQPLHGMEKYSKDLARHFKCAALGVVTEMTLRLDPRPDIVAVITFDVKHQDDGIKAYHILKNIYGNEGLSYVNYQRSPFIISISLSDRTRTFPEVMDHFPEDEDITKPLSQDAILNLAHRHHIAPWSCKIIILSSSTMKSQFKVITQAVRDQLDSLCDNFRITFSKNPQTGLQGLRQSFNLWALAPNYERSLTDPAFFGYPDEGNLKAAYWHHYSTPRKNLDPGRDGCGLRWGKFTGPDATIEQAVHIIEDTYPRYGYDPMVRILSTTANRAYVLSPMTYVNSSKAKERSKQCYLKVYDALLRIGYRPQGLPYDLQYLAKNKPPELAPDGRIFDPDLVAAVIQNLRETYDPRHVLPDPLCFA